MDIIIRKKDIYVCSIAIAIFSAWVAYAMYDNHVMREELEAVAEGHLDELFEPETGFTRDAYDYLAIVDSGKAFNLFGRGWGVIHVYLRKKGDVDFKTFEGVEYYYRRDDGEWHMTDSAGCGAFEHHIRAFDTFLAQNIHVPNRVFDRALGIDFDYSSDPHDHDHDDHDHDHHRERTPSNGADA